MPWTGTEAWTGTDAWPPYEPMPVPPGLTATPISDTRIDLAWSSISSASSYDIERDGTVIAFGHTGLSYSDTGLGAGTAHTYRVRSVD